MSLAVDLFLVWREHQRNAVWWLPSRLQPSGRSLRKYLGLAWILASEMSSRSNSILLGGLVMMEHNLVCTAALTGLLIWIPKAATKAVRLS